MRVERQKMIAKSCSIVGVSVLPAPTAWAGIVPAPPVKPVGAARIPAEEEYEERAVSAISAANVQAHWAALESEMPF